MSVELSFMKVETEVVVLLIGSPIGAFGDDNYGVGYVTVVKFNLQI